MPDKGKYKKDSYTEKKSKAWNRGKLIQIPVTLTEGLAGTDKGSGCWQLCLRSPPLGLHKRTLNSPSFLTLLIHTKHKTIR